MVVSPNARFEGGSLLTRLFRLGTDFALGKHSVCLAEPAR